MLKELKQKIVEDFYKKLGFSLVEIKDNVFREKGSVYVFQTDSKNHTVDCSTILYDDAVKIYMNITGKGKMNKQIIDKYIPTITLNGCIECSISKAEARNKKCFNNKNHKWNK